MSTGLFAALIFPGVLALVVLCYALMALAKLFSTKLRLARRLRRLDNRIRRLRLRRDTTVIRFEAWQSIQEARAKSRNSARR